jgi:hypothetical protein
MVKTNEQSHSKHVLNTKVVTTKLNSETELRATEVSRFFKFLAQTSRKRSVFFN